MNFLAFLAEYWDSVLVVLAFLAFVLFLIKRGETAKLEQILFFLVTQAEKDLGAGTGQLKYATVADWVYQRIPVILQFLFTASDIRKLIEDALATAKEKWSKNGNFLESGEQHPPDQPATE